MDHSRQCLPYSTLQSWSYDEKSAFLFQPPFVSYFRDSLGSTVEMDTSRWSWAYKGTWGSYR
jgi:hypothetical protein